MNRKQFLATMALTGLVPRVGLAKVGQSGLRVRGRRLNDRLRSLADIGRTPEGGSGRVAFSDADLEGRAYVSELMREAALDLQVDAAGNILGTRPGALPGALPIVLGSHIDTVANGGHFDGCVGAIAAVELAQVLAEAEYANRHPVVVAIWAAEEMGIVGSRAFVGQLDDDDLALPAPGLASVHRAADDRGRPATPEGTVADGLRRIGGAPDRLGRARHGPGSLLAYVELHVEQGGVLDESGVQIGVVEGIVGVQQYDVTFEGEANHAGTTPMDRRRDPMLAAARLALAVNRIVRTEAGRQVGTVGRISAHPGAPNVIPGSVTMSVELRDLSSEKLNRFWGLVEREARTIASSEGVSVRFVPGASGRPALTDSRIRGLIEASATRLGFSTATLPSGAGHDAQALASICPMGMIFVPSVGGISHSPNELTDPTDIEHGAQVLLDTVVATDRGWP